MSDIALVPLRELLAESQNGISKRRGDSGSQVAVLRLADISRGTIDESDPREIQLTEKEVEKYALRQGDLVCIRVNGSKNLVGRVVPFRSCRTWAYCDHFIRLRPRHDIVDFRYLAHFFETGHVRRYVELNMVSSAGQNTVSQGTMLDVSVPLPPLTAQREIVAELEKQFSRLDEAVASLQRVKVNLKRYKASVLKDAVEGRLVPMESIASDGEGNAVWVPISKAIKTLDQGWSPQCESESRSSNDEWAVMKTTAIQPMEFRSEENKLLPSGLVSRANLSLMGGDLLITRAGPRTRVGVTCLVKSDLPRLMICDKAYRLRAKLDIAIPAYLEVVLSSPTLLYRLDELKSGISDSGLNLTQKRFGELLVPMPSLAEQQRIVDEVDRRLSLVRGVEAEVDANLKRAQALRKATLQAAFSASTVAPVKAKRTDKCEESLHVST